MLMVKASQNDSNIVFVYLQNHPPTIILIIRNICCIFVELILWHQSRLWALWNCCSWYCLFQMISFKQSNWDRHGFVSSQYCNPQVIHMTFRCDIRCHHKKIKPYLKFWSWNKIGILHYYCTVKDNCNERSIIMQLK